MIRLLRAVTREVRTMQMPMRDPDSGWLADAALAIEHAAVVARRPLRDDQL